MVEIDKKYFVFYSSLVRDIVDFSKTNVSRQSVPLF